MAIRDFHLQTPQISSRSGLFFFFFGVFFFSFFPFFFSFFVNPAAKTVIPLSHFSFSRSFSGSLPRLPRRFFQMAPKKTAAGVNGNSNQFSNYRNK